MTASVPQVECAGDDQTKADSDGEEEAVRQAARSGSRLDLGLAEIFSRRANQGNQGTVPVMDVQIELRKADGR